MIVVTVNAADAVARTAPYCVPGPAGRSRQARPTAGPTAPKHAAYAT